MDKSVQSEPVVVWLSDVSEAGVQDATLEGIKQAGGRFCLNVKLPSIGYCDSHLDIASDYVDALFVGETIFLEFDFGCFSDGFSAFTCGYE